MEKGAIFNQVSIDTPQHSWFDLSYDHKLTFDMGNLIPIHVQETLPGDKFIINHEAMLRFQPLVAPIMHKVDVFIHSFFVPNRIIWQKWEKFLAGNPETVPPYGTWNVQTSSVSDYLGLPIGDWEMVEDPLPQFSTLPLSAYQCIWFEYYRDQNLQLADKQSFSDWLNTNASGEQSSPDIIQLIRMRKRAWEHDYFTSQLPFAQKGTASTVPIDITVGVNVPVVYTPNTTSGAVLGMKDAFGNPYTANENITSAAGVMEYESSGEAVNIDFNGTQRAIGSTDSVVSSTTINDLRAAFALQKWLERNARAGTRYTEIILANFGVKSSDARLQRPEYIGGSKSTMAISEVLQTGQSTEDSPQGNMAGHGISVMGGKQIQYYCEEHGFIMSIMSVRPKTAYHQGLSKMWSRFDKLDYYWPDFANIGEEAVKRKELYLSQYADGGNEDTFGYLPRYTEYRYLPSRVSGKFHTLLDYWALQRTFDEDNHPVLNEEFIVCEPSERIFAVYPSETGYNQIIAHVYSSIKARRPIPKYGNPGGLI